MPETEKKRQHKRFQVPGATLFYRPRFAQMSFEGPFPLLDLGKGGLGFATHGRIRPGQKASIALNVPSESRIQLRAHVVYCRRHFHARYPYHVGVMFAPFASSPDYNSEEALEVINRLEQTHGAVCREELL